MYSDNWTIIRYNNRQTCGNHPRCFGHFRPSSGRYSTNNNTVMAVYVIIVQRKI